jgi:cyanophycinase
MTGSADTHRRSPDAPVAQPGPVMIVGGAEDKLNDREILARFLQYAGGADALIVVISTASSLGEAATELYGEVFGRLGADRVSGLHPLTRAQANAPAITATLENASAVFLTGGNQLRLASVVAGTSLARGIEAAHRRGAVVAGTSAGASALAGHMMAFGASGATPKHRMAHVSLGLGLLPDLVVDQHFEQRTRLGRLLSVVAQSPSLIGVGLDEDTAAIVHGDHTLEVIGRGAVTLIDGSNIVTDAHRTKGHRPMMVSGAILHSIPSGFRFDLTQRQVLPSIQPASRSRKTGQRARAGGRRAARSTEAEGESGFTGGDAEQIDREASE